MTTRIGRPNSANRRSTCLSCAACACDFGIVEVSGLTNTFDNARSCLMYSKTRFSNERSLTMINGGHVIIYSKDAEADRAFFRKVLKFSFVDVHDGWLIFKLPPSEIAVHPSDENDMHEF